MVYALFLAKFFIGFVIMITHMNLSGKTQLSQMTPVDFIGNFVLGGIIGGVIYSDSIPMTQYIITLLLGVSVVSFINWISKHVGFFRAVTIGNPIPIIKNGHFIMDNVLAKSNKIDIINIASRLHTQGIHSFQEVRYAQIEPDGQITVVCEGAKMPSVIIMKNGAIISSALQLIDRDEAWLRNEIEKKGIKEPESIFLAEFWDGKLNFIMTDGKIKHTKYPEE